MLSQIQAGMTVAAGVIARCLEISGIMVTDYIYAELWRTHGGKRYSVWKDKVPIRKRFNLFGILLWLAVLSSFISMYLSLGMLAIVTTVGKNDLLTQYFRGSGYTAAWYIGLVDGATAPTYVVGDTMASHPGWTENIAYSNATRVQWIGGTASAGSIDNSASQAAFNINATATIAGAFMVNNNAKSGTAGILYSAGNFIQGNRSVQSGDTLSCTAIQTVS